MERLLSSGAQTRVGMVLDELQAKWTRIEEQVPTDGPPDYPHRVNAVTYLVGSGPLEGSWSAQGEDADLLIFERMMSKLDAAWRKHLDRYSRIAAAMRKVGR